MSGVDVRVEPGLEGIWVDSSVDRALDYSFNDQHIGSLWTLRDSEERHGRRLFPWPPALDPHLDGLAHVVVTDHVTGDRVASAELVFGTSTEPLAIVDHKGNPLGLDKSQRLVRLFGTRSTEQLQPLLDAMTEVLDVLDQLGIEPFLAYGTLLGAVREGNFIGHDSDADLGYVSRFTDPVDAASESFRLQRELVELGYPIHRYSGLAFKIIVTESDGTQRGLDVFGGFFNGEDLYLMGEVGHPFRREWIFPRATASLAGVEYPVPAQPEHLLEAMYGPSWRVPDPAYVFETPPGTIRRLNDWFRGTRFKQEYVWGPYWSPHAIRQRGGVRQEPSEFVRWARTVMPEAATAVELGCGDGRDARWLAEQGTPTVGTDYLAKAFARHRREGAAEGLPLSFALLNFNDLRSAYSGLAALLRTPGPRLVVARHFLDATNTQGREAAVRTAAALGRGGGKFVAQAHVRGPRGPVGEGLARLREQDFLALVARHGGTVVERHLVDAAEDRGGAGTSADPSGSGKNICRWVIEWDR